MFKRNVGPTLLMLVFLLGALTTTINSHYGLQTTQEPVLTEPVERPVEITTLAQLQELVDAAAEEATKWNMTIPVIIPDGSIIRGQPGELLQIRGQVFITSVSGRSRTWRLIFRDPPPDSVLIEFFGDTYGAGMAGCDIRVNPYEAPNITAIRTAGKTKNATLSHLRFEHRGMDVFGLHVRGHESLTVDHTELRCSVPLVLHGGDNHCFTHMDIGTAVDEERRAAWHSGLYPCTCVWVRSMPFHITFDGSQTWQGGDYAVYGIVDSKTSGQSLTIYNLRYEQTLSRLEEDKYAVYLKFLDRHLERMTLYSCRWTDRVKGLYVTGCLKVDWIGCWMPGTKWWRKD